MVRTTPNGPTGGGGSSDDGDDGGSSGGGGGDSGGIGFPGFESIAPGFLTDNLGVLQAFVTNPRNFIVGAIATTLLETVFGIVTSVLNVVFLVVLGSNTRTLAAPGETLGIADVPVFVARQLGDVGGSVGDAITTAISDLNAPLFEAANVAGPLSPLVVAAVVIGETIVVLWVLQRIVFVLADFLQLGGLTE